MSSESIGNRLCPTGVSEYSTLGGISAYRCRCINPSASRPFNVSLRTFEEMSGMALLISLKRVVSFSERTQRIKTGHLPEKRERTFLTGHSSIRVYFSKFSFIDNAVIINNTNLKVTALRFCNFLEVIDPLSNFAVTKTKWLLPAKLI